MKRFAAFALIGSFPLLAVAGPVSVYPPPAPPPAAPASSLNQPLSAAVQTAATTLPPAPVMTSTPSWGSPAVLPGTTVAATNCTVPCGDPATCQPVRPYFNVLAARPNCETVRGSCLDKFKEWLCYRSSPGGFPCQPVPYRAPLRAYFPMPVGCGSGACASGAKGGACVTGRETCGTVAMPVTPLGTDCAPAATCRPRVKYVPLTARAEVPAVGCDACPTRPKLFERLFGVFAPKCDATCAPTCPPPMPVSEVPMPAPVPLTTPMPAPQPMAAPMGTGTTPLPTTGSVFTPQPKPAGTTIQLSPQKPFTNP